MVVDWGEGSVRSATIVPWPAGPVRGDLLAAACVFSLDYRLFSGLASGQAHLASEVVICSCQVPRVLRTRGHLACEVLGGGPGGCRQPSEPVPLTCVSCSHSRSCGSALCDRNAISGESGQGSPQATDAVGC